MGVRIGWFRKIAKDYGGPAALGVFMT